MYGSSFLNGSCNAYTTCIGGAKYGFVSSLTCYENVSLKHTIPEKNHCMDHEILLLFWLLLPCNFLFLALQESNLLPGYFCHQVVDNFLNFCFGLMLFILLIYVYFVVISLYDVAVNTQHLQSLVVWHLEQFWTISWHYKESTSGLSTFVSYCYFTYHDLQNAWVVVTA